MTMRTSTQNDSRQAAPASSRMFVVNSTASRYARLRPVGIDAVRISDDFWTPRLRRNREQTLPAAYQKCQDTGALTNFARAAGEVDGQFHGRYYSDSDVYKWIESASWALAEGPDAELEDRLAETVRLIVDAQDTDGYLNTYFSVDRVTERWTDLQNNHEMYCLGHLVQAAVAHARVTGARTLLDVAVRAVELVERRYAPGLVRGACGHPELELALVELYRHTKEQRWLQLAAWQLESRGAGVLGGSEYLVDHIPVRDQRSVTGHAVRALYLYSGIADLVLETGDTQLAANLEAIWDDLTQHKMSLTGGVGARWDGESFGDAYELPDRPYNETCAAIASIMLAWRLLLRTGDGRYRDLMEWTLYNAVLPGLSDSGSEFFYQNPLADAGRHRRQSWFDCACCPPNISRLMSSLPGYLLTTSVESTGHTIWLHLLMGADATIELPGGGLVRLRTSSSLPWSGSYEMHVSAPDGASPMVAQPLDIRLPRPAWAAELELRINGEPVPATSDHGYLRLDREWNDGDRVNLTYAAPVRLLQANPAVGMAGGRVAITKGPLVYCLEQVDHTTDILNLRLHGDERWEDLACGELPGVKALRTTALEASSASSMGLYEFYDQVQPSSTLDARLVAVPYFAWANRAPGRMTVLIPLVNSSRNPDQPRLKAGVGSTQQSGLSDGMLASA